MKLIASTILLLSLFSCVFAQEARKIGEFGDLPCDEFLHTVDGFFIELNASSDAKGYIFIYEGKVLRYINNQGTKLVYPQHGEAKAGFEIIRQQMKFRAFDKNRIVFIKGGFRENYAVEFWIVPNNATPPKPTPTLKKMKYRKGKSTRSCSYL